jgi:hypothetical protein
MLRDRDYPSPNKATLARLLIKAGELRAAHVVAKDCGPASDAVDLVTQYVSSAQCWDLSTLEGGACVSTPACSVSDEVGLLAGQLSN